MKLNPSIKNMSNEYIFFTDQTALTFRICLVNCFSFVLKRTVGEGTLPSVRRLDATFSPRRLRFSLRFVRVGFVANEVALARVLLLELRSSPVSMTPLTLYTRVSFISIDAK
jgi:hypothetical protein